MSKNSKYVPKETVKEEAPVVEQNDSTGQVVEESQVTETTSEVVEEVIVNTEVVGTVSVEEEKVVEEVKPQSAKSSTQKGFTPVHRVEFDLTAYAEAMATTKAIDPVEGGKWQYSLLQILKATLSVKDQEVFNKEWNTILNFFKKNKDGIFNETYMFRFPDYWVGSPNEFSLFRRLVYTIIQTADTKTRNAAIKDINMGLVAEGLTEQQRTRLFVFYGV